MLWYVTYNYSSEMFPEICITCFSVNTSRDAAMEFYPPKYWGLDPIYHACVKLTIADVLNLTEHPTCKGTYAKPGCQYAAAPTFIVDAAINFCICTYCSGTHIDLVLWDPTQG